MYKFWCWMFGHHYQVIDRVRDIPNMVAVCTSCGKAEELIWKSAASR
jgi:hypothetical protein